MEFNYARTARLIEEAIEAFHLDLGGLTVYTEAATGGFAATAAIAVGANAEQVFALTRDSSYGTVQEAKNHTTELSRRVGDIRRINYPNEKKSTEIGKADVITNTGFVRPINDEAAEWLGPSAAVALMYEPWEFREQDVDIEALWANGIPVLGTDERDERIETQCYLRALAPRIAFESDLEVFRGEFLVIGAGRMARHAATGLEQLGGTVKRVSPSGSTDGDNFSKLEIISDESLRRLDAVIVADHETDRLLVGKNGYIDPNDLSRQSQGAIVLHICGPVSADDINEAGLPYVPDQPAPPGYMSFTTGYLGPRPVVDLHTAGLRIGADLSRAKRSESDFRAATEQVASTTLAADFDESFKRANGFYD